MRVAFSFDFDGEVRRIALAQALRPLSPAQLGSWVARHQAYRRAGLGRAVLEADDRDALRRHASRLASVSAAAVDSNAASVNPIFGSVNLGVTA